MPLPPASHNEEPATRENKPHAARNVGSTHTRRRRRLILPDGGDLAGEEASSLAIRPSLRVLRFNSPPPGSSLHRPLRGGTVGALPATADDSAAAATVRSCGVQVDVQHLRCGVRIAAGAARALQVRPTPPQRICFLLLTGPSIFHF